MTVGRAVRIAAALPSYAKIGWWGLVAPRREPAPLVVHQGVVVGDAGVLLAMRAVVDRVVLLLRGAITAADRVGLMMNVPRAKLQTVVGVLPALGKPTVSTLTDDRWVAVNTVIQERLVKELLPRLRDAGARGIVEYPLNKIIE